MSFSFVLFFASLPAGSAELPKELLADGVAVDHAVHVLLPKRLLLCLALVRPRERGGVGSAVGLLLAVQREERAAVGLALAGPGRVLGELGLAARAV